MGRLGCAGLMAIGALSCAPEFAYTRPLGDARMDLHCPAGFADCATMAGNICSDGYRVEQTKSGASGTSVVVVCNPPPPPQATALAHCEPPEPAPNVAQPKPECAGDYQCTELNARCQEGRCVVVPVVGSADDSDRCVVGNPNSGEPVPMFPTTTALNDFISAAPTSKAEEFMLVARLNGSWVDVGVRCRTLGQFARGRRVQLLSGLLVGRDGWIATAPETSGARAPEAAPSGAPAVAGASKQIGH